MENCDKKNNDSKEVEENNGLNIYPIINIKSAYILQIIFSHINKKRKLRLVNYNIEIQKKINVLLEDYRTAAGIYRIGGRNGQVKIYTLKDKLLFEGEYVNGKKNGKGKEYYKIGGTIEFEGDYLNGERNGIGIQYHLNGKKNYEGEFLNGERHGKGKEYLNDGKLVFEGEFKNGKRNKGKEYDEYRSIIYEGEFSNNKKSGKG